MDDEWNVYVVFVVVKFVVGEWFGDCLGEVGVDEGVVIFFVQYVEVMMVVYVFELFGKIWCG